MSCPPPFGYLIISSTVVTVTYLSGLVGQAACFNDDRSFAEFFAAKSPGAIVAKTFEETIEGMNSITVCHWLVSGGV